MKQAHAWLDRAQGLMSGAAELRVLEALLAEAGKRPPSHSHSPHLCSVVLRSAVLGGQGRGSCTLVAKAGTQCDETSLSQGGRRHA